jgi:hypothetical protein
MTGGSSGNTGSSSGAANAQSSNAPAVTQETSSQSGSPAVLSPENGTDRDGTNNVQRAKPNMAGSPVGGIRAKDVDEDNEIKKRKANDQSSNNARSSGSSGNAQSSGKAQSGQAKQEQASEGNASAGSDQNPGGDVATRKKSGTQEENVDAMDTGGKTIKENKKETAKERRKRKRKEHSK